MRTRILRFPLVSCFPFWIDDNANQKKQPLDIPGLDGLLPHAEGIWVESLTTGCADNDLDWNIIGYAGFDRNSELPGQPFFSIGGGGGTGVRLVGSQKYDANNFTSNYYRQHLRLELAWKLVAGTAKQGSLSAVMYVKTAGM